MARVSGQTAAKFVECWERLGLQVTVQGCGLGSAIGHEGTGMESSR